MTLTQPTRIRIEILEEPQIAFGRGVGLEPRKGLVAGGPSVGIRGGIVELGLVCLENEVDEAVGWLERLNSFIAAHDSNAKRFPRWPGASKALQSRFVVNRRHIRPVSHQEYQLRIGRRHTAEVFEEFLDIFAGRIAGLISDQAPACIVVFLPDELAELRLANPGLSPEERRALEVLRAEEESDQLSLFQPTDKEREEAEALRTTSDELLFRSFYRALKARASSHANAVPIQVLRHDTVRREDGKNLGHSRATRAWNFATTVFYKAGGIPWRPAALPRNVCFIGISFHHLRRRSGGIVYASVAQAVSSELEPFTLKGATIDKDQRRDKHPYLLEDQAEALLSEVFAKYKFAAGVAPDRIVVHKSTSYEPEEAAGFRRAAHDEVATCDLVWMRATSFRLVRRGFEEAARGTFCKVDEDSYLFTVGRVPWWGEYPGPHIPAPLQIGSSGETDLRERAKEILALSKVDWNTTEGISRLPITLSFARKVGLGMAELGDNQSPHPSYRFHA
jgi:hypothetical protein